MKTVYPLAGALLNARDCAVSVRLVLKKTPKRGDGALVNGGREYQERRKNNIPFPKFSPGKHSFGT